jgi:hypothetical protein
LATGGSTMVRRTGIILAGFWDWFFGERKAGFVY